MRRSKALCAAFVLATLSLYAPALSAQQFGNVYGRVINESGEGLPGAAVTLRGVNGYRVATSDDAGDYRFLSLDPGSYQVNATLDGFSSVEQPNVIVALNRNTTINFTLTSALQDSVTVVAESPLLDERKISKGTIVTSGDLAAIPSARDPWGVVTQAPGVLVSRVNVGGSESDQQVGFRAPGAGVATNDWRMDGIQITDVVGLGLSTTYYDAEQFDSIELSTGGPDVTRSTAGVTVNMVTKRGTNEFRGTARFLSSKDDGLGFLGQSQSDLDCSDLAETQDCETFTSNRIRDIRQYGFEAGGPAMADRLWFWGSWGVSDIGLIRAGGDVEDTLLENTSVKINGQLSVRNSFVVSWNNGNKTKEGRDAGPTRAPETTLDQRGPSAFWRFEDTHVFGSSLYLTGAYQKSDLGFQLTPRSGCVELGCPLEQEAIFDDGGVWRDNFSSGFARQPEDSFKIDGSYFFETGRFSHELKFGGRLRESQTLSSFVWPGRNIAHYAGENLGFEPGTLDFFVFYRTGLEQPVDIDYNSLWIQDTIAAGNWTFNVGFRWDHQEGVNLPGTTGPSPVPELLPSITFDQPVDAGFDWESVTPRLGVTRALGADRDTLLRASFSQFPSALGWVDVTWISPITYSYAYFGFFDGDGDQKWNGSEPFFPAGGTGFDPANPDKNLNTVDPDYEPEITSEATIGVEHSILPEFVVGLTATWRNTDKKREVRGLVRPAGTSGGGRLLTAADFVEGGTTSGTLPDGSESTVPLFTLDPSLEFTGFSHLTDGSREVDYNGLTLTLNKRLSNNWSARGYFNWGEGEWKVPQKYLDNSDPNDEVDGFSQGFNRGEDNDGALFYEFFGGRGDYVLQSGWQWNLTGIYQVASERPWGFNLSANLYGREGYILPYHNRESGALTDNQLRDISLVGGEVDRFRAPDLTTVDLRIEKAFAADSDLQFTVGLDLFNAFNEATVLARQTTLSFGSADWVQDVLSPRVWKIGVRMSWR